MCVLIRILPGLDNMRRNLVYAVPERATAGTPAVGVSPINTTEITGSSAIRYHKLIDTTTRADTGFSDIQVVSILYTHSYIYRL